MTPEKRPVSDIIADFAAGADRLAAIARDWSVGNFRHNDITNTDAILRGLTMLLAELRAKESGSCAQD